LQRIYYTDPGCHTFDAVVTHVVAHEGRAGVVLDRTAFYPTSGGQPFDTGTLASASVTDTVDTGDAIVHVVSHPLEVGTRVRGAIDWKRRFDHMQQHTGQHVLSAAFDRLSGNRTVGFHMGAEVSSIDLEREASAAEIERAVDEANGVVWANRPVSIRFVSPDEAVRLQLRKDPAREGTLRLIEIGGFDLSACGGTHVSSTGAIGVIAVVAGERVRGGSRLTFVCGGRALRALRAQRDAVAGCVRVLSVLPEDLPAAIERLQAESKDQRKTISRLQEALAVHEAASLLRAAADDSARSVIVEALDGWDAAGLKAIAAAMTAEKPVAVALFSVATPAYAVVARSAGVAVDAAAVLKALIARFGGRGGGKPDLAQAGGLTGSASGMCAAARELLADAPPPQLG
jgi:alanyl-tRNA synthetase